MLFKNNKYRVLLPQWVLVNEASGEKELISAARLYMERYPHYEFLTIEGDYAICQRKD